LRDENISPRLSSKQKNRVYVRGHPKVGRATTNQRRFYMANLIAGVGKDAPIITNAAGGRQSATPAAMHLCDPFALLDLGAVFQEGASRYKRDNWRKIDVESHLNKAIIHILAYMAGDTQDDHLSHAQCRVHMALATKLKAERDAASKFDPQVYYDHLNRVDPPAPTQQAELSRKEAIEFHGSAYFEAMNREPVGGVD
jgi:hypothetical protein